MQINEIAQVTDRLGRRASSRGPLVSVVIPCFDQGRFLAQAIDSVRCQSLSDLEIIVVDDGSTDDTPAVIERQSGVIGISQANAGLAAARNSGLRASRGRYVMFLDADDLLLPDAVARGARLLEENLSWAFVSGAFRYVDKDANPISGPVIARVTDDNFAALLRRNYIAMGATVLFRRSVLDRVGGFDPSLAACEDWDLHLRIARHYPVGQHREVVALYRRHDGNMSRRSELMLRMALEVLSRRDPVVRRDPHLRKAYRAGVRLACDHFAAAEFAWHALAEALGGRGRRHAGLEQLRFMLRHAPVAVLRSLPSWLGRALVATLHRSRPA